MTRFSEWFWIYQIWDISCFTHLKNCLVAWSEQNMCWLPAPFPQQRSYHEITAPLLQFKCLRASRHIKAVRKDTVKSKARAKIPLWDLQADQKSWSDGCSNDDFHNAFSLGILRITLLLFGVFTTLFEMAKNQLICLILSVMLLKRKKETRFLIHPQFLNLSSKLISLCFVFIKSYKNACC